MITFINRQYYDISIIVKHALDILGGFICIIITAVVGLFFYAGNFFESPGPLIKQKLVGLIAGIFIMLKFSSMYADSEECLVSFMEQNKRKGILFEIDKTPASPRSANSSAKPAWTRFPSSSTSSKVI